MVLIYYRPPHNLTTNCVVGTYEHMQAMCTVKNLKGITKSIDLLVKHLFSLD